jgi:hypothetical protein
VQAARILSRCVCQVFCARRILTDDRCPESRRI